MRRNYDIMWLDVSMDDISWVALSDDVEYIYEYFFESRERDMSLLVE